MVMINHVALQPTLSALQQAISSGALSLNQVNASVAQILVSKGHAACQCFLNCFGRTFTNQGCRVREGLQGLDWDRLAGDLA